MEIQRLTRSVMGNSSGAAANLTQPYIANEIGQYFNDPKNTNETARLLAHAALGAASAYISGNSATSGAAGAVTGEVIAQLAIKELYGDKDPNELTLEEKENVRAIATLASGLVGAASGGSFEDSAASAAAGYNAAVNNAESVKNIKDFVFHYFGDGSIAMVSDEYILSDSAQSRLSIYEKNAINNAMRNGFYFGSEQTFTDVTLESSYLFSIGHSGNSNNSSSNGLYMSSICQNGKCTFTYVLKDSFRDPLDIGIGLPFSKPYEIGSYWTKEVSY